MATRKKKVVEEVQVAEPVVVKGSHLTVTTHPDGRTQLEWDDAALEREVHEAIENFELSQKKPSVRAKAATRKKKND